MSDAIPYAKLGIPLNIEPHLADGAPAKVKMALARGLMPLPPDAQLSVLYVLAGNPDPAVAQAARQTARALPVKLITGTVGMKTHPKVLEFLVEFRDPDFELDERVSLMRNANDRTVLMVAARADKNLSEKLCRNQERLLVTPQLFVTLHANPNCTDADLFRAESFLRMQHGLPEVPARRPFLPPDAPAPAPAPEPLPVEEAEEDFQFPDLDEPAAPAPAPELPSWDPMAEIEAALRGEQSPALIRAQEAGLDMFKLGAMDSAAREAQGLFNFDFKDEADQFGWDFTGERDDKPSEEEARSLEAKIANMTIGQRIKLAYLGNKSVRSILIRDRNKMVAGAVVKSGRLSDQEVATYAGNKNLATEVIREIAMNGEWLRKYPVKVALANNPKTPVSLAVSIVTQLQKKELQALTRNRNIPSVVNEAAVRLFRQKYRQG